MSAIFDSSTTKLNINDDMKYKSSKRKSFCLIGLLVVLITVAVIFLVLFIQTKDENKTLESQNKALNSKITDGDGKSTTTTKSPSPEKTTAEATTEKPTVATTIDPSLPYANVRLPKNVYPTLYDLHLKVLMNNRTVQGSVRITVHAKQPTKYFILHAYDYTNVDGVLKNDKNETVPIMKKFLYKPNQFYVMELDKKVKAGKYFMEFDFSYGLKKTLKGLYQSTYKNRAGEEKLVAATQFQPVSARTAFPCFDEPALRANFSTKISHTPGYFALTNMPNKTTKYMAESNLIYNEFETTPSMPTYLLAFVVCDFGSKEIIANTTALTKMSYYAPKDQIDQIDYSMEVGAKILKYFESYYNVSYPLPKSDMIAIPDFAAGAMENWGLITYRSSALLYDQKASGIKNKLRVASVVAHELAHQWFGNIVTMEWWSDLWLNEGFASHVEYVGMDAAHPDWNVKDFQVVNDMASGLELDALVSSHPIYIPVNHPSEIDEIFDSISYSKGGSVLRMLENFLTTPVFLKGLTSYLRKYSYGNANTKDLFTALTEASITNGDNYNVNNIMDTWVLQMGFPVINVTKEDDSFTLTQERFLKDPKPDLTNTKFQSKYNYTWIVPFNYVKLDVTNKSHVKNVTNDRVWLNMTGASINETSPNVIIKGNHDQYGFFRVNYDTQGWNKIKEILDNDHTALSVKDRAGILADAFALAESGRLDYCTAISLFEYIDKEEEYLPWKAAIDGLSVITSGLTLTSPARKYLKDLKLKKVANLFEKLRFKDEENLSKRYLQSLVVSLACNNGHKVCQENVTSMFTKWIDDPVANAIPGDFRSLVYYFGVYKGGKEEWEKVLDRYMKNQIASEKTKLMYALAATQESWLLDRYLNLGLNESVVKAQDVSYVFSYVSNYNSKGRYLAWSFMKENWKTIEERYVESFFTMRRIFSSVTSGFSTQYELDQVKEFVEKKITNQGSATQIIKQSEEKIKARIAWIDRNEEDIEKCLDDLMKTP